MRNATRGVRAGEHMYIAYIYATIETNREICPSPKTCKDFVYLMCIHKLFQTFVRIFKQKCLFVNCIILHNAMAPRGCLCDLNLSACAQTWERKSMLI